MADAVIDNPILNSPYDEPNRHFRFDEQGITSEVVVGRRSSGYFVPIPAARKNSPQLSLATEWTSDRLKANDFVNQVRTRVELWRKLGRPYITAVTRG